MYFSEETFCGFNFRGLRPIHENRKNYVPQRYMYGNVPILEFGVLCSMASIINRSACMSYAQAKFNLAHSSETNGVSPDCQN
jgi:hypothetical protein